MAARQKWSGLIIFTLILSRIIIFAGIRRVFFREPATDQGDGDTETSTTTYYIGEQVLLEGEINPSSDITQYAYTLTTSEGRVFGLKSADIALGNYRGNVQIKGEVDEFKKKVPVIEVIDIVGSLDQENMTGTSSEYRYFASSQLGIDLSNFPGYTVVQEGGEIQIRDVEGDTKLTVTPFQCVPGSAAQDCSVLKQRLQEQQAQRFTTADNVTFTKFTEGKQWLTFNGTTYGYTITAESDDDVQTHAGMLQFLSEDTMSAYLEEARVICKNISSKLGWIRDSTVSITAEGVIEMRLEGTTDADTQGTCVVKSQAPKIAAFTLVSYDDGDVVVDEKKEEIPENEKTPALPVATGTVWPVAAPATLESWISYPSVRGWTLYISKDIVAYEGVLLTGNEQPGCPYQINLYYRNKDTDTAPADGRIFECMPSGVETLENQGYSVVGTAGDSTFLMKYLSDDINDVEFYVQ